MDGARLDRRGLGAGEAAVAVDSIASIETRQLTEVPLPGDAYLKPT